MYYLVLVGIFIMALASLRIEPWASLQFTAVLAG